MTWEPNVEAFLGGLQVAVEAGAIVLALMIGVAAVRRFIS